MVGVALMGLTGVALMFLGGAFKGNTKAPRATYKKEATKVYANSKYLADFGKGMLCDR